MRDLNEILVFVRVAHLKSFSAAAKSLEMPVSTVSRKVSELETYLGTTLIQRTTRKLTLTHVGSQYFRYCADLLQGLEEAELRASQGKAEPEGPLRISIAVGLMESPFGDFITDFAREFPKIEIDLVVTNQYTDLLAENVDVAIRFGPMSDSSLIAKPLGTGVGYLFASSEYLASRGIPQHPDELSHYDCIIFKGRSEMTNWELVRRGETVRVSIQGKIKASDMSAIRELARRGHGIALLPGWFSTEAIRSRSLERVLPEWSTPNSAVHAVYQSRRFMTARLSVFLRALDEWDDPVWVRGSDVDPGGV